MPQFFSQGFTQGVSLWLALTVLVALVFFLVIRWFLLRLREWLERSLQGHEVLDALLPFVRPATWMAIVLLGMAITSAAVLIALTILNQDISPALDALKEAGLAIGGWLKIHGARIALIIVLSYASFRILRRFAPRIISNLVLKDKADFKREEAQKRVATLNSVVVGTSAVVIVLIGGLMVLSEVNVSVGPMLAGLGIAGVAVGFGAQHLVADIINGILILMEDQYRTGDVASIGGKTGLVESVNLRRTVLRDLDGIVHFVPNSQITVTSNYTKEFSRVNIDIPVAYRTNLDHAINVLNRVGQELSQDGYFGPLIIEAPQVVRVNNFGDSSIDIKVVGVTRPLRQWEVTGALRKRVKEAFDLEDIEIPFPHRTIYWGVGAHPLQGDGLESSGDEQRAALAARQEEVQRQSPPPAETPTTLTEETAQMPEEQGHQF